MTTPTLPFSKKQRDYEKKHPSCFNSDNPLAEWLLTQYHDIEPNDTNCDILRLLGSIHEMSPQEIKSNLIQIMQNNT